MEAPRGALAADTQHVPATRVLDVLDAHDRWSQDAPEPTAALSFDADPVTG